MHIDTEDSTNRAIVTGTGTAIAVRITPDIVEQVVSITNDDVVWLKIAENGFLEGEEPLCTELRGTIFDATPYWIRWTAAGPPEKLLYRQMADQPEGFELRCDLKIRASHGELIGLSLAPSSARSFSRYVRRLQALRLDPADVVTVLSTRTVTNKKAQRFTVVVFDFVPPKAMTDHEEPKAPGLASVTEKESAGRDELFDGIPF